MIRATLLIVLWALSPTPGWAQAQREPVPMAWVDLFPWFYRGESGAVAGFAVELGEALADEVGFELAPYNVRSFPAWGQAQAGGTSILLPAVPKLPHLLQTNVFSIPVLETEIRLATTAGQEDIFDVTDLTGKRIGILAPGAGSDPALLPGATLFDYPDFATALLALLAGEVDAISSETSFVHASTRRAQLDDRIAFVEEPLQRIVRHVAIHRSRADLLEPINAAIVAMQADGRMEALIRTQNVSVPPPPPDVLRAVVRQSPPYIEVSADGRVSGFAIEVLDVLAARAGIEVAYEGADPGGADPLGDMTVDILPFVPNTPKSRNFLDFTLPVSSDGFDALVRAGFDDVILSADDLSDRRVGILDNSLVTDYLSLIEGIGLSQSPDEEDLLDRLLAGEIDVVVASSETVDAALSALGQDVRVAARGVVLVKSGPALRPGLGVVRQRLNAVILGFLVSQEYQQLQDKYFGTPLIWSRQRVIQLSIAFAAVLALGGLLLYVLRSRAQLAMAKERAESSEQIERLSGELETVFNGASSGIIALDSDGDVVRINAQARHMLGGISTPTPFAWPPEIRFFDGANLRPLDASADPIQRARSGHAIRSESHVLRRTGEKESLRYVRVKNAKVDDSFSQIAVVLVIDDVTSEERNRHAVDRKGRLDALGQLTGGIAHDFNNLLTSLLYSVVLAGRTADPEVRKKNLGAAEDAINRGRALTSRLMAFASRQPGLAIARPFSVIAAEFETLIRSVVEKNIDIDIELPDEDLYVFCDMTQLESALMNLVLYSRDAIASSGKGDRIVLTARPDSLLSETPQTAPSPSTNYVNISISDNGPGMDAATQARATDPFFTTKAEGSGTGLGLAMVYGFVRQANGDLRIYSDEGYGTTISLLLPRGSGDGDHESVAEDKTLIPGAGEAILLVEDEPEILVATAQLLEDFGYRVITAASGKEALEKIDNGALFDLLLTDVVMPGAIGGFSLARQVRERYCDVPVIYVSGYIGFTSLEMGDVVAPLLQKPAPAVELSRAIAGALGLRE